jgi:ABC-type phosphate transport system substrate-binding protein
VDLAAIPKTGQTIKVIGIIRTKNNAGGDGQKPEVIRPTAATIRDGTYPLAERIFLYVHPKASEAAKGFAKFLASESLEQAYHSHGLLPLVNSKKDQVVSPPPSAKPVPTEGWSFP